MTKIQIDNMGDNSIEKEKNDAQTFSPKEHLFGNLKMVEAKIKKVTEPGLRKELQKHVKRALSWKTLIRSVPDEE
jgi:hypothetical protein